MFFSHNCIQIHVPHWQILKTKTLCLSQIILNELSVTNYFSIILFSDKNIQKCQIKIVILILTKKSKFCIVWVLYIN